MKAGDILLFKAEKDFVSNLIAWGTNSKYSHVAMCISPELDLAIEAITRGGVRARSISQIPRDYDIYRVKPEYTYELSKAIAFLVKQLNNRYDYWGVAYLGLLKIVAKLFKRIKQRANLWQKSRDYFCSELCYEAYNHAGLDIVPDIPSAEITSPGDIAKSNLVELVTSD